MLKSFKSSGASAFADLWASIRPFTATSNADQSPENASNDNGHGMGKQLEPPPPKTRHSSRHKTRPEILAEVDPFSHGISHGKNLSKMYALPPDTSSEKSVDDKLSSGVFLYGRKSHEPSSFVPEKKGITTSWKGSVPLGRKVADRGGQTLADNAETTNQSNWTAEAHEVPKVSDYVFSWEKTLVGYIIHDSKRKRQIFLFVGEESWN